MREPAAAFSALAITRSMLWCSTSGPTPRRIRSRPGLPKMSPMKRIRTSDLLHRDRDGPAPPFGNFGQADPQLAFLQNRLGPHRIARGREADGPRKASEPAFDEVK